MWTDVEVVVVSTAILVGVLELTITAVYQYLPRYEYILWSTKLLVEELQAGRLYKYFLIELIFYGNFGIFCIGIVKTKQKVLELLKKESKLFIVRNLLRLNIDHFFH